MKTGAAYFASLAAGAALVVAAPASAQQTDWTKRVTMSKKGGYVLGNPLAKHRIAEYMSYVCGGCSYFERQSHDKLRSDFVQKGHISFEIRNSPRDVLDLTVAMLARCGGRTKFFGNHRALLAAQSNWAGAVNSASADVKNSFREGTAPERMRKIAKAGNLYGFMNKRGFSNAQINACLDDKAALDLIMGMREFSIALKVPVTPGFSRNDKLVPNVNSWQALEKYMLALPK